MNQIKNDNTHYSPLSTHYSNCAEGTMKHTTTMKNFIIGIIAVSALVCGCQMPKKAAGKKATSVVAERINIDVTIDTAMRRTLNQERKFLAVLEAYRETDIGPLSPGRVKYLKVKIGDYVEAGQVIAKMDDATYVSTDAQFQQVKAQYERSKSLYESNALSKAQFEGIEAQYTAMKRQMQSLQENTVITAPFSGIVTAKAVEEGELYSPSMMAVPGQSKGLVHIAQLNPLKLDLDVDDQTIQYLKKGMQVLLSIDKVHDSVPVYGRVEWVNLAASSMSRTFGARLIIQNPKRLLLPGYFAEAHIIFDKKNDALSVPRESVVDDRVFVLKGNTAAVRKVQVGWLTDSYAEILSGLNENDIVIVKGNKALPDSAVVNIVKSEE
jgi:membrane fusion protein, multidrug efflux system